MILITGTVLARPETADEVRRLALAHVHRSRAEAGCISHDVHTDVENRLRFVFLERWVDMGAVQAHFAVPASRAFARALGGLAAEKAVMNVYRVESMEVG